MSHAAAGRLDSGQQLHRSSLARTTGARALDVHRRSAQQPRLCAGCRGAEARYREGDDDPLADRPRTLCFDCFRVRILRSQTVAARLTRGWNAQQEQQERIRALSLRRRHAQIAARHALGL